MVAKMNTNGTLYTRYTDNPGYWGGLVSQQIAGNNTNFFVFDMSE
jgi:hypothetical protein